MGQYIELAHAKRKKHRAFCCCCHCPSAGSSIHDKSGIRHPASGIRHPASGIRHPASGIRHPALIIPYNTLSGKIFLSSFRLFFSILSACFHLRCWQNKRGRGVVRSFPVTPKIFIRATHCAKIWRVQYWCEKLFQTLSLSAGLVHGNACMASASCTATQSGDLNFVVNDFDINAPQNSSVAQSTFQKAWKCSGGVRRSSHYYELKIYARAGPVAYYSHTYEFAKYIADNFYLELSGVNIDLTTQSHLSTNYGESLIGVYSTSTFPSDDNNKYNNVPFLESVSFILKKKTSAPLTGIAAGNVLKFKFGLVLEAPARNKPHYLYPTYFENIHISFYINSLASSSPPPPPPPTCTTPAIPAQLLNAVAWNGFPGVNTPHSDDPGKDFNLNFNNCSNHTKIRYRVNVNAFGQSPDASNGLLPSMPSTGVAVQVRHRHPVPTFPFFPVEIGTWYEVMTSASSYTVPMNLRYFRIGDVVTPGAVNAAMVILTEYQ